MPPLIIFQGKQIQATWCPSTKPDHKFYPWIYANEKGWMKSHIFFKWFVEWEKKTCSYTSDEVLEGRLMIYDGHLSHVGFTTLQCSLEWKVTILKLPPNTTDLLQPLDVSVFKSLKQKWGQLLHARLRKTRSALTKSEFATAISSDDVWEQSFTKTSIVNGFRK